MISMYVMISMFVMISMYVCHDADMYTRREASFASAKEPYLDMEEGKNT